MTLTGQINFCYKGSRDSSQGLFVTQVKAGASTDVYATELVLTQLQIREFNLGLKASVET